MFGCSRWNSKLISLLVGKSGKMENTTTKKQKQAALLVPTLASFLSSFLGAALNVALPDIGKDLEADTKLLNLTATLCLLATALFVLPFGRLAEIVGRKKKIGIRRVDRLFISR